jgi:hypothetical protein
MRISTVAVLAGLLPIVAANTAFLVNIHTGLEGCFPYWEGCYSVSRGIRSGPGLLLFKILALPAAATMAWCWILTTRWLDRNHGFSGSYETWAARLGVAGAAFFLVYSLSLGTEGELYRWMRRYGVVFYFAFTGLAHLFLASKTWNRRSGLMNGILVVPIAAYLGVTTLMWLLGVGSAFKRKIIDNPDYLDRVENVLEWNFALALSMAFLALALVHRVAESHIKKRENTGARRSWER